MTTADPELDARILASTPRSAAERLLHAVIAGTAPEAPEMRPITFEPDDMDALRAYVAEEVELHGGLDDTLLMRLMEMDRSAATHERAMAILSRAPRLGTGTLI